MPHLVVLASSSLFFSEGQVHLPAKFESGMSKYAELFPGDVHVLARPAEAPDLDNLGGQLVSPGALNFRRACERGPASGAAEPSR